MTHRTGAWVVAAALALGSTSAFAQSDPSVGDMLNQADKEAAQATGDETGPSEAHGPTNFSRIGVGVSVGANGLGPTIYVHPIYDGTISVTIVPIVAPNSKIVNGGVKYDHVIARKRQAALYVDASFGFYKWNQALQMINPAAGVGVHLTKPYWNYAEVWAEVNLGGLIFIGDANLEPADNKNLFLPLPAAGVAWWF